MFIMLAMAFSPAFAQWAGSGLISVPREFLVIRLQ